MILYRPMVSGDVPAGLSLCRAAGWNQTADDWDLFLRLSPGRCCVAVDEGGQVRGTVTTVRYEHRFSWIGMVLVDPAHQRRGIGIQLLREALSVLQEEDTVKLDATPAGRHIYQQLDFVDEYPISRMETGNVSQSLLSKSAARPMLSDNMPGVLAFDRRVFDAQRESVLRSVLVRAPQFAWVVEGDDGIDGYCFGRPGYNFAHIGPVIAKDFTAAREVVTAALQTVAGPVVIDALQHSAQFIEWLSLLGFREQRQLIRMYRGTNRFPGLPDNQFAILGPEFG